MPCWLCCTLQIHKQVIDGVYTVEALLVGTRTLEKGFQISEPQQELTESADHLFQIYI